MFKKIVEFFTGKAPAPALAPVQVEPVAPYKIETPISIVVEGPTKKRTFVKKSNTDKVAKPAAMKAPVKPKAKKPAAPK